MDGNFCALCSTSGGVPDSWFREALSTASREKNSSIGSLHFNIHLGLYHDDLRDTNLMIDPVSGYAPEGWQSFVGPHAALDVSCSMLECNVVSDEHMYFETHNFQRTPSPLSRSWPLACAPATARLLNPSQRLYTAADGECFTL